MIRCKDIHKSFGEKEVLKGISFDIPDGKIFGLLGPSGAGKTTLIKILTGQLDFEKGEAFILDKEVSKLNGKDKAAIGIMMDQFGVYERLSCTDNLKIFADIYDIPKSRIDETLTLVGLKEAANRPALNLSKGMKVRLQLARVFFNTPKILFLDEPTTGLDPMTQKLIHKIILDKKESGCTIFLTTHNMEEAAKLCDEVALLNEGVIVDSGSPKDICRRYNHQKKILIHLTSGKDMEFTHDGKCAEQICRLMEDGKIETIHSSEPNLETVFLELTGRKLED